MNVEENITERIMSNVNKMRDNAGEMRIWKNIPLAKECLSLLQSPDLAEEEAIGKALAYQAIVHELPEYDVPRLVLRLLRNERKQLSLASAEDLKPYPDSVGEVEQDIRRLEDYIDVEHVNDEQFSKKYLRHLKADPIERTLLWEENYYDVEQECDRLLGDMPRGMGFCFAYWSTLRQVLEERGIEWKSPHQLNPRVMFD